MRMEDKQTCREQDKEQYVKKIFCRIMDQFVFFRVKIFYCQIQERGEGQCQPEGEKMRGFTNKYIEGCYCNAQNNS